MTNATATELQQETGLYDMANQSRMKSLAIHAPEAMNAFVVFDKAAGLIRLSADDINRQIERLNSDLS